MNRKKNMMRIPANETSEFINIEKLTAGCANNQLCFVTAINACVFCSVLCTDGSDVRYYDVCKHATRVPKITISFFVSYCELIVRHKFRNLSL